MLDDTPLLISSTFLQQFWVKKKEEKTIAKHIWKDRRKHIFLLFLNGPKQNFFSVQIKDTA